MSATPPVRPQGSPAPGGSAGAGSAWTEHRNAQGRVYWYNAGEKRSVWEKPTELKTARERAMDSTPWKEYQSGDRKYYVHSITKESSWTLPKELKDALDAIPSEAVPSNTAMHQTASRDSPAPLVSGQQAVRPLYSGPPPGFMSPGQGSASPAHAMSHPGTASDLGRGASATPQAAATPVMSSPAPGSNQARPPLGPSADRWRTDSNGPISGGEEAFMGLLHEKGVDASWSWEHTMRQIITEPLYKALGTLAERKAAFSKYIQQLQEEKNQARRERAAQIEPSVRQALEEPISSGRVKPWLSYEGMLVRCTDVSPWKKLEEIGPDEARGFWETIRKEMRDHDAKMKALWRQRNIENLNSLLRSFEADVTTRWKDARQTIFASDEWLTDPHLKDMDVTDMIAVFDDLIKDLERAKTQELREAGTKRKRDERKRRDWFKERLQQGVKDGWLHARSQFGDVYERFRDEPNFKDMLGQAGSSPLDLFYDVIDVLDTELNDRVQLARSVLARADSFRLTGETTIDDFRAALQKGFSANSTTLESTIDAAAEDALKALDESAAFRVYEELVRINKDGRRRAERKLRHLSEDFRYALKKEAYHHPQTFEPDATLDESWDATWRVRLHKLNLPEWVAFDQLAESNDYVDQARIDEVRRTSWERFVKRQREKVQEKKASGGASAGVDGRSISPTLPRKRRGDRDDVSDGAAPPPGRASRRERRAGEATDDAAKERDRRERRSGRMDEPVKRPRRDTPERQVEDGDSEKEEGEV